MAAWRSHNLVPVECASVAGPLPARPQGCIPTEKIMSDAEVQRSLAAREDRFRVLFEQSMDAIYVVTPDGRSLEANQAWLDLFGYSREELAWFRAIELYAVPSDRDDFLRRIAVTGFVRDEVRFKRKDGSQFDCERTVVAIKDGTGAVVAYQGVNRDISERKRAEVALRESEERLSQLARHSRAVAWEIDLDGLFTYVSPVVEEVLGRQPGDLVNKVHFYDMMPEEAREQARTHALEAIRAGVDIVDLESPMVCADGRILWVAISGMPVRGEDGALLAYRGWVIDITARKEAELTLRASESRLRSLFENSLDAIYIGTPDGRVLDVNQAWLDLFGYERTDLPGLDASTFYADPAGRTDFVRHINETGFVRDEVRYRRKDGSIFDCERIQVALKDHAGNLIAYQGVNRDITERKQAEEALRSSEERFRSLFEQSWDANYIGTPEGAIIDVNQSWLELFGYRRDELHHITALDLYADPADRASFLRRMNADGRAKDEVRFKKKDGTVFDCERTVVARKDEHGRIVAYQGIFRDVSQRNCDRAELERLANYDTLTGLFNRRSILDRLGEWIRHTRRYKGRLSIVMVDLDDFKSINDRCGHQVGDYVLADTAGMLRRSIRQTDFVGRYGGEEFLIILPRTASSGAAVMAERTRAALEQTLMRDAEGGTLGVTGSFGVAEWSSEDDEDALIRRADDALYRAKAAGRNRVEVAAGPSEAG